MAEVWTGTRRLVILWTFLSHPWPSVLRLEAGWLLENGWVKTMRNMFVWHDAATAVSPKVPSWTLDISQAESQFLFQKRRSNYLLFKVTFLSMALEISLCTWFSLCLSFLLVSHLKWTKCLLYSPLFLLSTAGKSLHSDNHSLTEYAIMMIKEE